MMLDLRAQLDKVRRSVFGRRTRIEVTDRVDNATDRLSAENHIYPTRSIKDKHSLKKGANEASKLASYAHTTSNRGALCESHAHAVQEPICLPASERSCHVWVMDRLEELIDEGQAAGELEGKPVREGSLCCGANGGDNRVQMDIELLDNCSPEAKLSPMWVVLNSVVVGTDGVVC
ncbi:hypothetical protein IFM60648_06596 [Aspergillus lentulus]|uniref:Transposase TnpC homeodomain domain-containing protein n=1 Tax=Aspergillus lentulus TaxID=293939 RepID=A0ABQ1AJN2_ASPLE|nr:hypothetical protein IFM60648_06596 [Aspergillus lentulus]